MYDSSIIWCTSPQVLGKEKESPFYIQNLQFWVCRSRTSENFEFFIRRRLISLLSKRKNFGFHTSFRYVVHLPAGENLTAFAICRQLAHFSKGDNLFAALSSCCDIIRQLASFTGIKFTKQEWVSQWVSQWVSESVSKSVSQSVSQSVS